MAERRTILSAASAKRLGLTALFIEGALWTAIRFLSFIYVLAQEADLGPRHLTPGWQRLKYVVVTAAVAAILFLAAAGIRNGAGIPARVAQVLAVVINGAVLVQGIAAVVRFSGAEAVVVAVLVIGMAVAALAGLFLDIRAAIVGRHAEAAPGHA
jgi:hypothetical protein